MQDFDYIKDSREVQPGHVVQVLYGGSETYSAMLAAIASAQESVYLETYIFRADAVGKRFADALKERAAAGLDVRVLFDAMGSLGEDSGFFDDLKRAGVRVIEYRPLVYWNKHKALGRRDHRKILTVDQQIGFIGGINIGIEYESVQSGGGGWHDIHARVQGPVVSEMAQLFARTWRRVSAERAFRITPKNLPVSTHGMKVALLANSDLRERRKIQRTYLHAVNQAKQNIDIRNAYFIPNRALRTALARVAKRGVVVRVIVPEHSDVTPAWYAGRKLYDGLLRRGIEILEWPGTMMHAKTVIIDRRLATVGSYNFDYRSLMHDLEATLLVLDPHIASSMVKRFDAEVERCKKISLDQWRQRPVAHRMLEDFFYVFRRWL